VCARCWALTGPLWIDFKVDFLRARENRGGWPTSIVS
jgi:hypothetical protein